MSEHGPGHGPEPILPESDAVEKGIAAAEKATQTVVQGGLDAVLDVVLPGTHPPEVGGGGHGGGGHH